MRLATKKIAHEFEFDRHCWLLELLPAGPSPFYSARSSLSPTPNYKSICATFSFKGCTGKKIFILIFNLNSYSDKVKVNRKLMHEIMVMNNE